ncbi:MAG TPA: hypothetical protein VGJ80_05640 [Gemmatimonadales bacterium]|jgi:hypothetical protein
MRRLGAAFVILPVLAGCYSYVPVATLQPAPGTKLSLVLNDEGRSQSARQVGPYTMRVEGELLQATDADYVLAVTDVVDIRGARSRWTGETVPLPRTFVMSTDEKRFSRSKTFLLIGAMTAGFVALARSFNILGFGGPNGEGTPPDPNGQ